MNGFPVVIRTLDPPLHEFLPKREDLMVDVAILPYADIPIARLAAAQAAILATRRKRSGRRRIPGEMAWVGGENGCPPPGTKNARVPRWPLAFFSRPDISSILGKNAKPAIRQEVRRPGEDCSPSFTGYRGASPMRFRALPGPIAADPKLSLVTR